jgi:hypothetical protein
MRFPVGSPAYKELRRRLDAVEDDPANAHLTESEMTSKLVAVRAAYVIEIRLESNMGIHN